MGVKARLRHARLSAQQCRLVCDQIRGLPVGQALEILNFGKTKASSIVKKVLSSALANAENNNGEDIDELVVSEIFADKGTMYKRMQARAKGRGCKILKPTCHITIVVDSFEGVN